MSNPLPKIIANPHLQVELQYVQPAPPRAGGWGIQRVALRTGNAWRTLLEGEPDREFATSRGSAGAATCVVRQSAAGGWEACLTGKGQGWEAREVLTLAPDQPLLQRRQTYRFTEAGEIAINPGFRLRADPDIRYTYALRAHEQPLAGLPALRAAVDWALPFPFHVWHDHVVVAIYGLNKRASPGTTDFTPVDAVGWARLGVYYPDTAAQPTVMGAPGFGTPASPGRAWVEAGSEITLTEMIAGHLLAAGEEPLLEAERLAAGQLLAAPPPSVDFGAVTAGIANFYTHCELWEPDAFGPGRGWFTNMWVHTQSGTARKRGEMSGYYDFGWGEGIAVEMMLGAVRHWKRTGDASLLPYVKEMTRNLELFKRAPGDAQPYFDRSDGRKFGDFLLDHVPGRRIWTHALGHTGSQLIQMFQTAPDYPDTATHREWLAAATSMARFMAARQKTDGDLQDIFDDNNAEVNAKAHRITARAVVCGLWVRLGQLTGERAWTARAMRLAQAVAPAINRYEYYNQMLDGIITSAEYVDGEAAYYVLEGLVPLAAATRDSGVLALCRKAAAFGIAWTYFYDVPKAHNGIARGGQCCRMGDFPLLYPIGPAKAMTPLLDLHALTGDALFQQVAAEAAAFIGAWQIHAPGKPWDGGMIHALGQYCNKHWGPDLEGQVDTGMATGNSLAALEAWLAWCNGTCKATFTKRKTTSVTKDGIMHTMTSRERMLTAIRNGRPDRVPVAPDTSNMIPCRLTGKPFWDIYLYDDPPWWQAYIQAAKHFQFDGWLYSVPIDLPADQAARKGQPVWKEAIVRRTPEAIYTRSHARIKGVEQWSDTCNVYFIDNPPNCWVPLEKVGLAKRAPARWEDVQRRTAYHGVEALQVARRMMGDDGVVALATWMPGLSISDPASIYEYYDNHAAVLARCEAQREQILRRLPDLIALKPDLILIGASGHMIANPEPIFRELSLPTLKDVTAMCKAAGMPSQVHCCGPEYDLVRIAAEETDLNSINPLETRPMGDCDLGEIKRNFGRRISLMGNLHTTEVMLRGTPETVRQAARRAMDDAAAGGGFILSTGDQCGRDTPDENLYALIETAHEYGKY